MHLLHDNRSTFVHIVNIYLKLEILSVERGIRLHSHVHIERTVPIIMAGCMADARNDHISTFGLQSDVTTVFLHSDFL